MQMADIDLTELERELLERVSIGGARVGVPLDCLDGELLERSPDRRGHFAYRQFSPHGALGVSGVANGRFLTGTRD
jgi:hypothetical protein